MRILITTTRGAGHFGPLRPFADAFLRSGHEVLVAAPPAAADMVRGAGHDLWTLDEAPPELRGAVFARTADASHDEANAIVIGELFAGLDARAALPGVLAAIEQWGPDAVLHESCEFAAALACERTRVPAIRVALGVASVEAWAAGFAATAVDELRAEWDLAPDPDGERLLAGPSFTLTPYALEDPDEPGTGLRFREAPGPAGELHDWWDGDRRPLVYLSFGSVAGTIGFFPGAYRAAIERLAPLPVRVLVTVGRTQDPAELGPLPANVHAERWVPQGAVMPHAAAIVCHGGAGTIRMGLAAGVPMAVLPLFAEQPQNARSVEAAGAGIVLDGINGAGEAVRALIERSEHRRAARRIAAEIAELPVVDVATGVIEGLLTLPRFPGVASSPGM